MIQIENEKTKNIQNRQLISSFKTSVSALKIFPLYSICKKANLLIY